LTPPLSRPLSSPFGKIGVAAGPFQSVAKQKPRRFGRRASRRQATTLRDEAKKLLKAYLASGSDRASSEDPSEQLSAAGLYAGVAVEPDLVQPNPARIVKHAVGNFDGTGRKSLGLPEEEVHAPARIQAEGLV
jgi:hypothetical protein